MTRAAGDPFLQHVATPYQRVLHVLGVPIHFAANRRWLLRLAEQAYAGLPAADPPAAPAYIRLLANDDLAPQTLPEPPMPRFYGEGDVFAATMSPADAGVWSLTTRRGMVTVSPAMARFPHHIRCELIELVAYQLTSHRLGAVGLHAACVAKGDFALILFGASGAGKSTLAFALMMAGWDLIAEDGVFVLPEHNFAVRGVPNFVHLLEDASILFGCRFDEDKVIVRRSGRRKLEIDVRTIAPHTRIQAPLGTLIFVDGARERSRPCLRRIGNDLARRLLARGQPYASRHVAWPAVREALLSRPAYRLCRGRDVYDAVALLERLAC
jgi:hypothetical protein